MDTLHISQNVPVLGDYDVCVVGAGPGGVGAAIAAARAGRMSSPTRRRGRDRSE